MNKNNVKKLSLKKEIVARLERPSLGQAVGGNIAVTSPCHTQQLCLSDFRECVPTQYCLKTVGC